MFKSDVKCNFFGKIEKKARSVTTFKRLINGKIYKSLYSTLDMVLITDYSQIQADFNKLFHEVTSQDFKAHVNIPRVLNIYIFKKYFLNILIK